MTTFPEEFGDANVMDPIENESYEPSEEEIRDYGLFLGLCLPEDQNLLFVAREGLMASVPKPWVACINSKQDIFYRNPETGECQWAHPRDEEFRQKIAGLKNKAQNQSFLSSKTMRVNPSPEKKRAEHQKAIQYRIQKELNEQINIAKGSLAKEKSAYQNRQKEKFDVESCLKTSGVTSKLREFQQKVSKELQKSLDDQIKSMEQEAQVESWEGKASKQRRIKEQHQARMNGYMALKKQCDFERKIHLEGVQVRLKMEEKEMIRDLQSQIQGLVLTKEQKKKTKRQLVERKRMVQKQAESLERHEWEDLKTKDKEKETLVENIKQSQEQNALEVEAEIAILEQKIQSICLRNIQKFLIRQAKVQKLELLASKSEQLNYEINLIYQRKERLDRDLSLWEDSSRKLSVFLAQEIDPRLWQCQNDNCLTTESAEKNWFGRTNPLMSTSEEKKSDSGADISLKDAKNESLISPSASMPTKCHINPEKISEFEQSESSGCLKTSTIAQKKQKNLKKDHLGQSAHNLSHDLMANRSVQGSSSSLDCYGHQMSLQEEKKWVGGDKNPRHHVKNKLSRIVEDCDKENYLQNTQNSNDDEKREEAEVEKMRDMKTAYANELEQETQFIKAKLHEIRKEKLMLNSNQETLVFKQQEYFGEVEKYKQSPNKTPAWKKILDETKKSLNEQIHQLNSGITLTKQKETLLKEFDGLTRHQSELLNVSSNFDKERVAQVSSQMKQLREKLDQLLVSWDPPICLTQSIGEHNWAAIKMCHRKSLQAGSGHSSSQIACKGEDPFHVSSHKHLKNNSSTCSTMSGDTRMAFLNKKALSRSKDDKKEIVLSEDNSKKTNFKHGKISEAVLTCVNSRKCSSNELKNMKPFDVRLKMLIDEQQQQLRAKLNKK